VAAQYFREVASAIEYLHGKDPAIIHRDVKPENILIQKSGEVKLTDFGWANYVTQPGERTTACGTLEYLPPEMIEEKGHDTCADIWCLGILLYEMLAGITPFKASGRDKILANIKKSPLKFPRGFPPLAKDLIVRMLEKDKAKRFNILQVKSHKWLLTVPPLRELLLLIVAKPPPPAAYQNNETENSCSENEIEEEVKHPPENTFRKSILMLKTSLQKKSLQVVSQRNSLKVVNNEMEVLNFRVKELHEKIEEKRLEITNVSFKNKEMLTQIFDFNLDLEKLQDLGSFYSGNDMKDMVERHLHLKKLVNLQKIILESLKLEVVSLCKNKYESESTLKSLQNYFHDLKTSTFSKKSSQSSTLHEMQQNLSKLKSQLKEKTSSTLSIDQSHFKELTSFVREKLPSFPNMHRELTRKLEVAEDQGNDKEQQISELTIEFEMKKSQKLYNLRKKRDEILRNHRKIKEEGRIKAQKDLDSRIQDFRERLASSRKAEQVDPMDLERVKKRLKVRLT
jgi:serine/threonine protein kinase